MESCLLNENKTGIMIKISGSITRTFNVRQGKL